VADIANRDFRQCVAETYKRRLNSTLQTTESVVQLLKNGAARDGPETAIPYQPPPPPPPPPPPELPPPPAPEPEPGAMEAEAVALVSELPKALAKPTAPRPFQVDAPVYQAGE